MVVPALNPAQARQPLPSYGLEPVAAAAERCVDKIEQVEEIEYDDVVRNINSSIADRIVIRLKCYAVSPMTI